MSTEHIVRACKPLHKNPPARYVLPAMDWSALSEVEDGVVNSKPFRSNDTKKYWRIVHAYANVNSIFHGNIFSKYPGRTALTGIPSKVSVVGPMPPGSSRSSRDAIMKIYEERKRARALGVLHWSDDC